MPVTIETLHVFDFDGTLFRSPAKPEWWTQGWWGRLESLSPPCVPEKPDAEWWVASTVAAARKSISNPSVYAIMITGRPPKLRTRVQALLAEVGLRFDETHFSNGDDTLPFKLKTIAALLSETTKQVEMWEDRAEHVGAFDTFLKTKSVEFKIHHVSTTPMQIACSPEDTTALRVTARFLSG
jgi:hypothetical protein